MDKKEQILKVAGNIFAKFGLKKTTMDEIAKLARIGKSTLYYYFKSKESMFSEIINKESQILREKLTEAVEQGETPQQEIRNYITTRMSYLKELVNYNTALTDEYLDHYSFVEKARKDLTQYEMDVIKNILIEGINQNVFAIEDTDSTARMIIIVLKAFEYPLLIENRRENMEAEIELMLNIIFKGIEVR
jgi:AcrR family transcriptional regulator